MHSLDKLKRLKNEVNRLFHEGLDEEAVIDRLRSDEQFSDIGYEQVQALYSNLQEESNAEAESKRQIVEKNQQITERQQKIEKYQRQITKYERLLVKEQQMKTELEFVDKNEQKSKKFLIYDEIFVNQVYCNPLWQGRFLISVENGNETDDVHTIKVQDLLQDATKSFTIQKVGEFYGIYALKFPFVLFRQISFSNRVTYFQLAKFNFEDESLQVVQSLEFDGICYVLVNASDTSKFILKRRDAVNECTLVGDQIRIGRKLALGSNYNTGCVSYFDEQFCALKFVVSVNNQFRNLQLTQVKMLLCDLEQNEHSTQDLDSTPEFFHCFSQLNFGNFSWIRDTVFLDVKFRLARKWGVIFTNPQVRNWKFVDFASDLRINCIQGFVDGTLMICSEEKEVERRKRRVYKLQMRKPDFLRNMAWNAIIKLFKETKVDNPYEEARQYLPLNSEIQPFVLTEN